MGPLIPHHALVAGNSEQLHLDASLSDKLQLSERSRHRLAGFLGSAMTVEPLGGFLTVGHDPGGGLVLSGLSDVLNCRLNGVDFRGSYSARLLSSNNVLIITWYAGLWDER